MSSSRNVTSSRPMKQSPQPDVVSNSIVDERTLSEIGRLEAMCESNAKQQSAVTAALCEKTKWFEAMTVVAGYFIEQVWSYSVNSAVKEFIVDSVVVFVQHALGTVFLLLYGDQR